ncbi:MAG: NUDIX domain-containing protein [Hyphomicrobiaceae bacterium]|nr:NUDIX domain-containing protein [Hyphomicrobiaceae bacterium]
MSGRVLGGVLRPWWRLTRGLTLGAQGVVIDDCSRVLLIRHRYRPGWYFPGGGVERNETLSIALKRELDEEAGVILTAPAEFHGLFANIESFPGDHIGVFVVREWEQPDILASSLEIAEQGFFATADLPKGTSGGTRRRLAEIFDGAPKSEKW